MSVSYSAIQWNSQKRRYDLVLAAGLLGVVAAFVATTAVLRPEATIETLLIRGLAVAAFLLLHVILAIGPLARLDRRFQPLVYNRRHLGVTLFVVAAAHAAIAIVQFHAGGDRNPLVSMLTAYRRDALPGSPTALAHMPFEPFGAFALAVLFVMAATSHDFWLRNLGASLWKAIHLAVLPAYGALVAHVALGALQSERSVVPALLLALGAATLLILHLAAARVEARLDGAIEQARQDGFVDVAGVQQLREGRGVVVRASGMRIALFCKDRRVFAVSNVCRHQGGPLGEGRVLDGCITCPWHGWQYLPEDGCSPPPFAEVVETYPVRLIGERVLVQPQALPLRTRSEGVPCPEARAR
jgi:nitrite reductase/ring-hydroxylating ferredoxin subunit